MPVAASDLDLLGSLNRPEDDTSLTGGGKDVDASPRNLVELAANDALEVLSDNAGDTTQQITAKARKPDGSIVSEQVTLNGTTAVQLSTISTVERGLTFLLDSDAAGTVTVRRTGGGATVTTIPPGERASFRTFIASASEAAAVNRFEKLFYINNHGTLALLGATIELTADPAARIRIGAAPSKDDSATVANRKTTPASVTFVDDNVAQPIPGTDLGAGEAIGVWVEQGLLASDSPFRDSYTIELAGTTT